MRALCAPFRQVPRLQSLICPVPREALKQTRLAIVPVGVPKLGWSWMAAWVAPSGGV